MTNFYLLGYNPGTPQYTFPRRGGAQLSGTCIIHTAECAADNIGEDTAAEDCARFIANRADYGSYHTLVDSDSIIEMAPYEYETWQDSETNNWAVGISAALRTSDWGNMPADREERYYRNLAWAAADFVKYMRTKGIEVERRRISGAEARARKPGFCAHGDSGISRSDPGVKFNWDRFFNYINQELEGNVEEEMNAAQEAMLRKIHDRVFGRDIQRWFNPHTMEVREENFEGAIPARSTDIHDIMSTNKWIEVNTNKILDAVAKIPGIDTSVIAGLRAELEAELKEATENIKVTLVVQKDEEVPSA